MSEARVVIWDPLGEVPDGEIVAGKTASLLVARKVATLPVEGSALKRSGISGWSKRSFGKGWTFAPYQSERGAPVVLHVVRDLPTVHWCARVVADAHGEPMGRLKLAMDPSQAGTITLGLASREGPVQVERQQLDKWGGWVIAGKAQFSSRLEGFAALSLYGTLSNARVLWVAASQAR